VTGSSTALKATADLYTCNGSASENWTVESNGTIVGDNSGLCLSVTGASTSPGAIADLYTCNGSASENWTVG
jgi:chitinase